MSDNSFQQRIVQQLQQLEFQKRLRLRRVVMSVDATTCEVDGRLCVNFATNDYLGLSHHPDVIAAFRRTAEMQVGSQASALVAGRSPWHERLERSLADFEHAEAALLFPSGFAANTGTIAALVTSRDAVFCDRDNHASIFDGCRGAGGRMFVYRRDQLDRLSQSIGRRRGDYDQVFIVTDTVFSMDGTAAPLQQLADIAAVHDAVLMVDEAHGTGVFGEFGGGICEKLGMQNRVPVRIGTLSKAIGTLGGFVTGNQSLIDWLRNTARSQFFSTALPPAVVAAAGQSLRIIQEDVQRRERLHQRCRFARNLIAERGLQSIEGSEGPIVPIVLGEDDLAIRVSESLQSVGFFIPAIRPPTVAVGTARLRMSVNSGHTELQIEHAITQISKALDNVRR